MNKRFLFLTGMCVMAVFAACQTHYFVLRDKTTSQIVILDTINVPEDDSLMLEFIKPYKAQIDSQMNEIIAYSEIHMYKDQPEGLLNNFISDVIFQKGNEYLNKNNKLYAPICLLNYGGLRSDLPKGAITLRNIYELMPFENELVAVQISGAKVKDLLQYIVQKGGMPITGIRLGIKDNHAVNVSIKNAAFDESQDYLIITSDYLAVGGDEMNFFLNPLEYYPLGCKVRDAIIEYLKEQTQKGNTVSTHLDKRIYYEK